MGGSWINPSPPTPLPQGARGGDDKGVGWVKPNNKVLGEETTS